MPTLETLKTRIGTVELLQSVVRTMKTLAAVSIRQQEKAIRDLADYCRTIDLGLSVLLQGGMDEPVEEPREPGGKLVIVVLGSDQGLCGRFNEQVVAHASDRMASLEPDDSRRLLICVGKRAYALLTEAAVRTDAYLPSPVSTAGILSVVNGILLLLDEWKPRQRLDRVAVCHSRILHGNVCAPFFLNLVPFDRERLRALAGTPWQGPTIPLFTMERKRLLALLIRHSLFASLYRALAESMAAENASRLASMQAAGKNISERLDELNLRFRDLRQSIITEELLDIVAGYEAMATERGPRKG